MKYPEHGIAIEPFWETPKPHIEGAHAHGDVSHFSNPAPPPFSNPVPTPIRGDIKIHWACITW